MSGQSDRPAERSTDDISLGELARNLARLERTTESISLAVNDIRSGMTREIDLQVTNRMASMSDRVTRLERILYGAVALILAAFLTAVSSLVIRL